jgi:hypothetical protein
VAALEQRKGWGRRRPTRLEADEASGLKAQARILAGPEAQALAGWREGETAQGSLTTGTFVIRGSQCRRAAFD